VLSDAVLFDPGSADLEAGGMTVLGIVAEALKMIPNDVIIEGHTDSRPISTSRFPSNWELSTARATAVLRFLAGTGIDPGRLSAMGYGDTHPVGDNATAEGQAKNRRVEIIVLTDVTLEPILADAAGDASTTTDGGGAGSETADGAGATGAPAPAVEP
jgi:chemotaxis protein MotB